MRHRTTILVMSDLNYGQRRYYMAQVSDNNESKLKLTDEELKRLVDYFEVLIQMDQEQKRKIKRDEDN